MMHSQVALCTPGARFDLDTPVTVFGVRFDGRLVATRSDGSREIFVPSLNQTVVVEPERSRCPICQTWGRTDGHIPNGEICRGLVAERIRKARS